MQKQRFALILTHSLVLAVGAGIGYSVGTMKRHNPWFTIKIS